ncbi:cytochrome c-type biogenesis protein [uncultured Lentibacter sp.]|uniref:cytochrome c-type biogenesis protein n=1 Tax=uncultured Lentibacter sp. TaxID=1659309 RepID=UPI00263922A8|nr:cytochrome c-type biogenesis protein [uncultured Lentibacter sp.]MCW1954646.1 cytochrome c-type biogenesis protein CcmH [Roseobacter sp.]
MRWLLIVWMLWAGPALAVQPDEILSDPRLEERARDLSRGLRCLVCRNENIDDSNAELARDLRLLVRERLVAGDTNDEVLAFVVSRYGEYVLLNPTKGGSNMILYYAGPGMLLLALLIGGLYLRTRAKAAPRGSERLSADEAERLKQIMGE